MKSTKKHFDEWINEKIDDGNDIGFSDETTYVLAQEAATCLEDCSARSAARAYVAASFAMDAAKDTFEKILNENGMNYDD